MLNYTKLTKNMVKHLKKGEEVSLNALRVKIVEDKIIITIKEGSRETELFYRLEKGDYFGFSRDQLKNIFSQREEPIFITNKK